MKRLLFIILIGVQPVLAQQELERANTYFERAFYSDAIPLYEQVLSTNRSQQVLQNLADAYYRTYDMHSAARWYNTLISRSGKNVDASYYFKLNQSLKAIGKYQEAERVLQEYYQRLGDSVSINKIGQDNLYLASIQSIGDRFAIQNLPLNTPASEFAAIQIDSNLIYTAARKKNTSLKKVYRWNNQNYLDIYIHPMDKIGQNDSFSNSLSGKVNTKMHEGTYAITKDRKTIYFTRNNFIKGRKRTDNKKISNLKIYKAEWIDGEWSNITELPFNSDDYSTEHPALSHDETKLYFSSDRPGGYGSFDLYSVDIISDGSYGVPKNLGSSINTDKKEQFPFLDTHNNLYFASNGHPGFGLLDIFISKYESGNHQNPDNLGLPVNSGYDDFAISFHSPSEGYFSSNRPSGKGSDDVYSFEETKPLILQPKEMEKSQNAIKTTDIVEMESTLVKNGDRIMIKAEQIHFDYNLWYLRNEAKDRLGVVLDILQKYPNSIIEVGTHTDSRGNLEYNRELSQKRANSVKDFLVSKGIGPDRIIAKGYGESRPLVKCETDDECSEEDHELNRRCEFVVIEGM
ncbi:OmpA family protein [Flagellimonas hadalis]|uniref:OmpA family protein n=1 Tax=Flagellimonas hadalis TaxID=2597517 RepID=A0A5N5IU82_9FLAO|nr:OmpA family protein [Allomuricauda hadalis]KAB5485493.1 OmpA family protein [Allomuricauda hadalis]